MQTQARVSDTDGMLYQAATHVSLFPSLGKLMMPSNSFFLHRKARVVEMEHFNLAAFNTFSTQTHRPQK